MQYKSFLIGLWFTLSLFSASCAQQTGADQLDQVLELIKGKRTALFVNHTSMVKRKHLVDTLKSRQANLVKIFSPEHGFRGDADAGEDVSNATDPSSGLPIISLYGPNKKPSADHLKDVDVVVFDMQDIGVRFFTYISSMHYMMEACAEQKKKIIILDRPNPNAHYVDGPVLEKAFTSFVGMHPVPIVYGMTIGEYAQMVNGEGWLANGIKCDLTVMPLKKWKHADGYSLPIKPSPNLPNDHAILMYPSTCLFEGTSLSIGRGTRSPFELVGHPDLKQYAFSFTPISIPGMAKTPVLQDKQCFGLDLRNAKPTDFINLDYLIELYQGFPQKDKFFISYIDKLAGTATLREQIKSGMKAADIRKSWQPGLENFKKIRARYLLYP